MGRSILASFATAFLLVAVAAPAFAQGSGEESGSGNAAPEVPDSTSAPVPDQDAEVLQIIGQRADVSQQDQALAISAFGQEQLDNLGVSDVSALQQNVPSLFIGQSGTQAVITLRGVGINNLGLSGEQGVLVHQDGIALGRPSAALGSFYDIAALNVLRGPQGTQGGKHTTGGWIEITSAPPAPEFAAQGDFQVGTYNQYVWRALLNTPIYDDKLMLRVTGRFEDRDGYQRALGWQYLDHYRDSSFSHLRTPRKSDSWADAHNLLSRVQLKSLLGDGLELLAIGQYAFMQGNGSGPHLQGEPGVLSLTGCNVGLHTCHPSGLRYPRTSNDPRYSYRNFTGWQDVQQMFTTLKSKYEFSTQALGDLKATAQFGFNRSIADIGNDGDLTQADASIITAITAADQYSFEVKLATEQGRPFDWRIGALWWEEKVDIHAEVDLAGANKQPDVVIDNYLETDVLAGFGEIDWWLSDTFRIGAGVRWSEDVKEIQSQSFGLDNFDPSSGNVPEPTLSPLLLVAENWERLTYKVDILWNATDTNNFRFNFTTGYKSGGFPIGRLCSQIDCDIYRAENVKQYELTSTNDFFDGRLRLNLVWFWTDYEPYQICFTQGVNQECRDNGSAITRGFEIETTIFPVPQLMIQGNFNILDAHVDNHLFQDPTEPNKFPGTDVRNPKFGVNQDLSGNTLPASPKYNLSLLVRLDVPLRDFGLPEWGKIAPQVQYQYRSAATFRIWDTPQHDQGRNTIINVRTTWSSPDGRYRITAFVNNIGDVDRQSFASISQGNVIGNYDPPRTAGFRFDVSY
ncbi:MAG: TonB-dependent receptor [Myxococcota bacterium]|nr:TonB-dependent receptor [Myxococcota bacterium]